MRTNSADNDPQEQLYARLLERTRPCQLLVDKHGKIISWWGSPSHYGLGKLAEGDDLHQVADFTVGMEPGDEFDLPVITTPNGVPASVEVRPIAGGGMSILLLDARNEYHRQYELQQQANEVELLSRKQQALLRQLEAAQSELEKKRAEAEAANSLKSRFIAKLSHEFRTPLASVIGYAELLKTDPQADERPLYVDAILRGSRHLLSLVENLIDQGSLDEHALKLVTRPASLDAFVADVRAIFTQLAIDKGIVFIVDTQALPQRPVLLDVERLRQVLVNIVGNAVKFTHHGSVTLHLGWDVDRLTVVVADTGPGIAASEQARVFQPFSRGEINTDAGAGLGLSISQRLVALMGGDIELESNPGRGSRFAFTIDAPLADAEALSTTTAARRDAKAKADASILIAEDDDDIAALLEIVLAEAGYRVERVADGQLAVDTAMATHPDVMLLDINLPVMSGIDAVSQLRQSSYRGKVVALTATASAEQERLARSAGCDDYWVKTLGVEALLGQLQGIIDQP